MDYLAPAIKWLGQKIYNQEWKSKLIGSKDAKTRSSFLIEKPNKEVTLFFPHPDLKHFREKKAFHQQALEDESIHENT